MNIGSVFRMSFLTAQRLVFVFAGMHNMLSSSYWMGFGRLCEVYLVTFSLGLVIAALRLYMKILQVFSILKEAMELCIRIFI